MWVAGFAPMERRQVAYAAFLNANPDIKEIAAFGSAQNPALDTQAKMEAVLKRQITAVWAAWDEFAKGAARPSSKRDARKLKSMVLI